VVSSGFDLFRKSVNDVISSGDLFWKDSIILFSSFVNRSSCCVSPPNIPLAWSFISFVLLYLSLFAFAFTNSGLIASSFCTSDGMFQFLSSVSNCSFPIELYLLKVSYLIFALLYSGVPITCLFWSVCPDFNVA